jgi:putative MATE family efflux protein
VRASQWRRAASWADRRVRPLLRRSPYDREIFSLALPALGALAAEPLYLLADTAIVGHLGTTQLAALALAAVVLSTVVALCNFLTYATTAHVARLHGAGREAAAGELAAQALWLALFIGCGLAFACLVFAVPLMSLLGGSGHVADLAARYLRISAFGLPFALIALAGQGWLRGMSRLREPLVILLAANTVNIVLEVVLVYGLDLGLDGSALGTVLAQAGMGVAFAALLLRAEHAGSRRPAWAGMHSVLSIGSAILVRTAALLASFLIAGAVCARISPAALGAHQIAYQLFVFLALVLDAIAIAGQVIVGRMLGASDGDGARAAARRMIGWSLVVGCGFGVALLALQNVIPELFTNDAAVIAQAEILWPLFALMQPTGAIVFALDGILIGAGDARYLAGAMVFATLVFIPIALATLHFDWGVAGVWWGLNALMLARMIPLSARFASGRWVILGAEPLQSRVKAIEP